MTLLEKLVASLTKLRADRTETQGAAYWRVAASIAKGIEPKDKPEAIASAMEAIDKTDEDLERDAALLAELAASEMQLQREGEVHRTVLQLRSRAIDLDKEVEKLRTETKARAEEAEAARRQSSATESSLQTAREHATQIRRKLAARGHQAAATWVADHDAEQQRRYAIEARENELRAAKQDLAQALVELADWQKRASRELPPHPLPEHIERHRRDQEQAQLREQMVDKRQARVTEIELELQRLQNQVPAK